ncbi:MAG: hypothetical protein LAT83_00505 [Kiritimatiellae bacterium]|nr:hypothetical protein [Kiritimatiellia bacterium]
MTKIQKELQWMVFGFGAWVFVGLISVQLLLVKNARELYASSETLNPFFSSLALFVGLMTGLVLVGCYFRTIHENRK